MANPWLRLWVDMPNDPKWRTIAKVSGQTIPLVLSVYIHILVIASNADERGRTQSMSCEDIASALDAEIEDVAKVLTAMQGRVLDKDRVSGWDKRQPIREDGAAERAKQWRERNRTQPNADKRPDKDTEEIKKEKEQEPTTPLTRRGCRLPADFAVTEEHRRLAAEKHYVSPDAIIDEFRDYWIGVPGTRGVKLDWDATFRNRMREKTKPNGGSNGANRQHQTESRADRNVREAIELMDREAAEVAGRGSERSRSVC